MFFFLALALAAQRLPASPDGPGRWSSVKTDQTITNELSCATNGKFSVILKWRLRHGLVLASIKRHGMALPHNESDKLVNALANATDLLSVQMSCVATKDALIDIVYVSRDSGKISKMKLATLVRPTGLELLSPVQLPPND